MTCVAPSYIAYLSHKEKGVTGVLFWIVPLDDLNTRVFNQVPHLLHVPCSHNTPDMHCTGCIPKDVEALLCHLPYRHWSSPVLLMACCRRTISC